MRLAHLLTNGPTLVLPELRPDQPALTHRTRTRTILKTRRKRSPTDDSKLIVSSSSAHDEARLSHEDGISEQRPGSWLEASAEPRPALQDGPSAESTNTPPSYHQSTRSISHRLRPSAQSAPTAHHQDMNDNDSNLFNPNSYTSSIDSHDHLRIQQDESTRNHHDDLNYSQQQRVLPLANSWLVILVVAPLTIALLTWLLVLLVRRRNDRRRRQAEARRRSTLLLGASDRAASLPPPPPPPPHFSHDTADTNLVSDSSEKTRVAHDASKQVPLQCDKEPVECTESGADSRVAPGTAGAVTTLSTTNTANANFATSMSSSSSPTSSSSSSTSSWPPLAHKPANYQHHYHKQAHRDYLRVLARKIALVRLAYFDSFSELNDQTNAYLITVTTQEILTCLVISLIAILNIIRVRNLFCCNLIMFALIVSKLMNLLTLTTFTISKLFRLIKLPVSGDHYFSLNDHSFNTLPHTKSPGDTAEHTSDGRPRRRRRHQISSTGRAQSSVSRPDTRHGLTKGAGHDLKLEINCISEESSSIEPVDRSIEYDTRLGGTVVLEPHRKLSARREPKEPLVTALASDSDQDATIARLIDRRGHDRLSPAKLQRPTVGGGRGGGKALNQSAHSGRHCPAAVASIESTLDKNHINATLCQDLSFKHSSPKQATTTTFSRVKLSLLLIASSALALFCLYLRLMATELDNINFSLNSSNYQLYGTFLSSSSASSQQHHQIQGANSSSQNADHWTISIYGGPMLTSSSPSPPASSLSTSSTTEASTRYESAPAEQQVNKSSSDSMLDASLAAAHRFSSPATSRLRQLIDHYELAAFFQLLFDTRIQTNRFSCTLASANYAPLAVHSMLTLYGLLILFQLVIGLAIQLIGGRRVKQFSLQTSSHPLCGSYCFNDSSRAKPQPSNYYSSSSSSPALDSIMGTASGSKAFRCKQPALFRGKRHYNDLLKQNLRASQMMQRSPSVGLLHLQQQQQQQAVPARGLTTSCSPSLSALHNLHKLQQKRRRQSQQPQARGLGAAANTTLSASVSSLLFPISSHYSQPPRPRVSASVSDTRRRLSRRLSWSKPASQNHTSQSASKRDSSMAKNKSTQQIGSSSSYYHTSSGTAQHKLLARRLATSQPNNLNQLAHHQSNRLSTMNGVTGASSQLAWLPLASGAQVAASLSRIDAHTDRVHGQQQQRPAEVSACCARRDCTRLMNGRRGDKRRQQRQNRKCTSKCVGGTKQFSIDCANDNNISTDSKRHHADGERKSGSKLRRDVTHDCGNSSLSSSSLSLSTHSCASSSGPISPAHSSMEASETANIIRSNSSNSKNDKSKRTNNNTSHHHNNRVARRHATCSPLPENRNLSSSAAAAAVASLSHQGPTAQKARRIASINDQEEGEEEFMSSQQQQQQQLLEAHSLHLRKQIEHQELKQDLRLTKLMILYAHLLNHGPILVSNSSEFLSRNSRST